MRAALLRPAGVLLALALLTSCGGSGTAADSAAPLPTTPASSTTTDLSSPTGPQDVTTTTPAAPTPSTSTGTPGSSSSATSAASPTSSGPTPTRTTPSTSSATRKPTPTPSAGARWPKALGEPQQGDPVWAVYLALAHSTTAPAIDKALRQAATVGYTAVPGDLACDQGAIEALNVDQYDFWSAAALYFTSERDARTFATRYSREVAKVVGRARVKVGCLD